MNITGAVVGDISIKSVQYYPKENTRVAVVALHVRWDRKLANDILGDLGEQAIFAPWFTDEADGEDKSLYKTMTPNVVFENHLVEILSWKGTVSPKLGSVKPVKDEQKVEFDIELPLPVAGGMRDFYSDLVMNVGTSQQVFFQLSQPSLPITSVTIATNDPTDPE